MKYILIFVIMLGIQGLKISKIDSYSETGHDQFATLSMTTTTDKLLVDYTGAQLDKYLNLVKGRVFGEKDLIILKYGDAQYTSSVIFSRSNKTREKYTFSYNLDTVVYSDVSVSVKGTLSVKKIFKNQKGDLTTEGNVSLTYSTTESLKITESEKMSVDIHPNKKITLHIVGTAKITNGVSKNYFLGITTSKGGWEVVDVITACYELLEEDA